jgi:hypothetical protein
MFMFIGMYNILLVRHVLFDLLLFQLIQVELIDCLHTLNFNECLCVRPSPGHHAEEDEG